MHFCRNKFEPTQFSAQLKLLSGLWVDKRRFLLRMLFKIASGIITEVVLTSGCSRSVNTQLGTVGYQNTCTYYHSRHSTLICDRLCEKGSYSLSNCMCLTIHNLTCEYGTSTKFGHFTLLT